MKNIRKPYKADLKDWELGDWPDMLRKAIEITVDEKSKTVKFCLSEKILIEVARDIAKQAIEAFFEEGAGAYLGDDGIGFAYAEIVKLPLRFSYDRFTREGRDKLVHLLNQLEFDKEDGCLTDLEEYPEQ